MYHYTYSCLYTYRGRLVVRANLLHDCHKKGATMSRKPKRPPKPSFTPGDHARTTTFLPPVYCGSVVTVLEAKVERGEVRYQVQPTEYESAPVWAYEGDLAWILLPQ